MNLYEVAVGPAAQVYITAQSSHRREALIASLKTELLNGPNKAAAITFRLDDEHQYIALPLSFNGVIVVFRYLSVSEVDRMRKERDIKNSSGVGFLVVDLLPPESGIFLQ